MAPVVGVEGLPVVLTRVWHSEDALPTGMLVRVALLLKCWCIDLAGKQQAHQFLQVMRSWNVKNKFEATHESTST